ncbi:MAG: cytochrome c-type biogenesis protein [Pseudomonadota bacterium]
MASALNGFNAGAADVPYEFQSASTQARYEHLIEELRCLVCQNQSLADSHAELAQDLRDEVFRMLNENATDQEIRDFMVARYGDFVLYKPPLKLSTLLLWFGPLALLGIAGFIVLRLIRTPRTQDTLSDEEQKYAATLRQKDANH